MGQVSRRAGLALPVALFVAQLLVAVVVLARECLDSKDLATG